MTRNGAPTKSASTMIAAPAAAASCRSRVTGSVVVVRFFMVLSVRLCAPARHQGAWCLGGGTSPTDPKWQKWARAESAETATARRRRRGGGGGSVFKSAVAVLEHGDRRGELGPQIPRATGARSARLAGWTWRWW